MAQNSAIGWTHHTANLWWGCVEVSPLCDNCYAREWAKRYDRAKWGADEPRLSIKSVWSDLTKFQRKAEEIGEVHRVFVGSMMDIFEKPMPVVDAKGEALGITTGTLRDRFFNEVVPASPNLLFLLLTKRPANITKYVPQDWEASPPRNVMFGTSAGTQKTYSQMVLPLLGVRGRRFVSIEPLLEPVDATKVKIPKPTRVATERHVLASVRGWCESNGVNTLIETDGGRGPIEPVGGHIIAIDPLNGTETNEMGIQYGGVSGLEWVIVGCESLGSRTGRFADGYVDAARTINRDCRAAKVPVFNKQMPINGRVSHNPAEWPDELRAQELPVLEAA